MMTRPEHWEIPREKTEHKPATIKRLGPKPKLPPMRTAAPRKPEQPRRTIPTFVEMHQAEGTLLPANEQSYGISPQITDWRRGKRKKSHHPVRWTEERTQELKAYVEQGLCLEELGKIYGTTPEAIAKAVRRIGLKRPPLHKERAQRQIWSPEEVNLLMEMYRAGKRQTEIAEALGRDAHNVCGKLSYELKRRAHDHC